MRRLLVLPIVLLALAAHAADSPPANLQFTGDHWTAWSPPTEFPEGAQLYLIRGGDTLWELSGRFYGDPYLWPQIWEQNRYIQDAHWIYPGDPLVVGVEVTPIDELEALPADDDAACRRRRRLEVRSGSGAPVPLGSADDIFCSGYIGDPDEQFAVRIAGSEYGGLDVQVAESWVAAGGLSSGLGNYTQPITAKLGLVLGDIVYLDQGENAGLLPGSLYMAVEPRELVRHVDSRKVLGRQYKYLGRVRLLSVQESTAIGEIVHSCHPIGIGTVLKPFEDAPIPLARRTGLRGINDPVSADAAGRRRRSSPSPSRATSRWVRGTWCSSIAATEHDVTPGDIYTIYRLNGEPAADGGGRAGGPVGRVGHLAGQDPRVPLRGVRRRQARPQVGRPASADGRAAPPALPRRRGLAAFASVLRFRRSGRAGRGRKWYRGTGISTVASMRSWTSWSAAAFHWSRPAASSSDSSSSRPCATTTAISRSRPSR